MLKGCQRKIILVKDTGSPLFSEAYFVLSEEAEDKRGDDIVEEATRIVVGESRILPERRGRTRAWIFGFLLGAISCGFLFGVWALIYFGLAY